MLLFSTFKVFFIPHLDCYFYIVLTWVSMSYGWVELRWSVYILFFSISSLYVMINFLLTYSCIQCFLAFGIHHFMILIHDFRIIRRHFVDTTCSSWHTHIFPQKLNCLFWKKEFFQLKWHFKNRLFYLFTVSTWNWILVLQVILFKSLIKGKSTLYFMVCETKNWIRNSVDQSDGIRNPLSLVLLAHSRFIDFYMT